MENEYEFWYLETKWFYNKYLKMWEQFSKEALDDAQENFEENERESLNCLDRQ